MKKVTVVLGEENIVEGVKLNTTVKEFRKQLEEKNYTEIAYVYRAGKHVFTFVTEKLSRELLVESGLVKPTKEEKRMLRKKEELELLSRRKRSEK